MKLVLWCLIVAPVLLVDAQFVDWFAPTGSPAPTAAPTAKPFCVESCATPKPEDAVCACGKDFSSICHAKCAGYLEYEISETTCEETHCRKDGKNPCNDPADPSSDGTKVCVTVWQRSVDNKCVGATYSCVQTSMLLTCPSKMENPTGTCLVAGGGTLYTPNKCFADSLGLEAKTTGCVTQEIDGQTYVPKLFMNDQGSLNYYHNLTNQTLMDEFGDVIEDRCNLDCAQDRNKYWKKDPRAVKFQQFCLTFYNECQMNCTKEKYKDRTDSYWNDNTLTISSGQCQDPCAEDSPFLCGADENCYPINQEARCFKPFAEQAECMIKNCENWNSTEPPTDPVCVKVYAGIRVDNVYRGTGSVSAYTYRDGCMAKCEGFEESDWVTGSCSDNAVTECKATCGSDSGSPVCAKVQVQVQIEQDDQLAIQYEEKNQTIESECMAKCLGWDEFTTGECKQVLTTSIVGWTGFEKQTCPDYANDKLWCYKDSCQVKEKCGDAHLLNGCQACTECNSSPKCTATEFQGREEPGCAAYAPGQTSHKYCSDEHRGSVGEFTGKTACQACPVECKDSPACDLSGFSWAFTDSFGRKSQKKCSNFNSRETRKFCGIQHSGLDTAFDGKTGCDECTECSDAPVCAQPYGFVNANGDNCDVFVTNLQTDPAACVEQNHYGRDPDFIGKTACDVCPACMKPGSRCNIPDVGFVGFKAATCKDYAVDAENSNFDYCFDDIHQGPDAAMKNKNACEACSECSSQWRCAMKPTGFFGYKGAPCSQYAKDSLNSNYEYCAIDKQLGPDVAFKNKNACEACASECAGKKACNPPTDKFVGYQMEWTCEEYDKLTGNNLKYCTDKYKGPNTATFGNSRACDHCPVCQSAPVCSDVWRGPYGTCSGYANRQKYCANKYNGDLGEKSKYFDTMACDQCKECENAVVCQAVWSYEGNSCSKYDSQAAGSWNKYCNTDKADSAHPAAASFFGQTACTGCPSECQSNPNC